MVALNGATCARGRNWINHHEPFQCFRGWEKMMHIKYPLVAHGSASTDPQIPVWPILKYSNLRESQRFAMDTTQPHKLSTTTPMDEFKRLCVQNGLKEFKRTQNTDDTGCSRFLRAQRYDVAAAFRQFHDFQTWHKANNVRGFYKQLDVETYDESRKMVCWGSPLWMWGWILNNHIVPPMDWPAWQWWTSNLRVSSAALDQEELRCVSENVRLGPETRKSF